MTILFYTSALIAVVSALLVVSGTNIMRSVLSLLCLILAVASLMYSLGATFIAVLLIVIYAGAIIVLFVFVIMILNQGSRTQLMEKSLLTGRYWIFPAVVLVVLLIETVYALSVDGYVGNTSVTAKAIGFALMSDYMIAVELASILLLAALVSAFHFARTLTATERDDE